MDRRRFCRLFGGIAAGVVCAGCATDPGTDTADPPTDGTGTPGEGTTRAGTATDRPGTTGDPTTTVTATPAPGGVAGQVSTRGRYAVEDGSVVERESDSLYDVVGAVPGYTSGTAPPGDLVVLVHGVGMTEASATAWFEDGAAALRAVGYRGHVVGFSYDARAGITELTQLRQIARENGRHLGEFIETYAERSPGTNVRLVGHSQGGQVVCSTVKYLQEDGWGGTVASVTLLAAAVDRDSVALDGPYGRPLAARAEAVDNFWDDDDTTMAVGYYVATGEQSLGSNPAAGETPDNYEDHEVTYVPSHDEYLHPPETGAAAAVVGEWTGAGRAPSASGVRFPERG